MKAVPENATLGHSVETLPSVRLFYFKVVLPAPLIGSALLPPAVLDANPAGENGSI